MKNLFPVMVAAATMMFASCGSKTEPATEAVDTVVVEQAELNAVMEAVEAGDATQTAEALKTLQTRIEELVASGDIEAANKYRYQLEKWYNENKDRVDAVAQDGLTVGQLVEAVKGLPTSAEGAAESAAEAAKADAQQVGQEVKAAAQQKANEAMDKAQQKANEAAQQATQQAADKANEAVQKPTQKAASKLLGK